MSFGLMLSLGYRLASVMPVLEGLGQIEILDSLSNLSKFSCKSSIVEIIFSNGFEACSKELCVPFLGKFSSSFSHVDSDLSSLEPFSD